MNHLEFEALFSSTVTACHTLLQSKGVEYSGLADRLANFKRGAGLTGASPLQVAFIFASKHYDSIASFVRDPGRASSEPIEGRLHDLINYCLLMKAIVVEIQSQGLILKSQDVMAPITSYPTTANALGAKLASMAAHEKLQAEQQRRKDDDGRPF